MERFTEYHCGVAVIKNKELLKEAMAKLAAYEDVEEEGRLFVFPGINEAKECRKNMNDGWTPVEEQLPKERNLYLATAESAGFYFRLICHWNAPGWTEENGQQKIIAWRPLPEPYCPERTKKESGGK